MTKKKSGLGRGLDALIPSTFTPEIQETPGGIGEPKSGAGSPQLIPIDQIQANPRQPRKIFNDGELNNLALSIKEHGIIQPLILTQRADSGTFTLIAGERRLQAARIVGLASVPAIIRTATDQDMLELALIENVQRTDLNPLEAARAYQQLADEFNLTQEAIAKRVGKSRVAITNTMRLLHLDRSVQKLLVESKLSEGIARALLGLPAEKQAAGGALAIKLEMTVRQVEEMVRKMIGAIHPVDNLADDVMEAWIENKITQYHIIELAGLTNSEQQSAVLHTILTQQLTPDQTRTLIKKLTGGYERPEKPTHIPDPEIKAIEEKIRNELGTKVKLNYRRGSGSLVIHYFSQEELEMIIERITSSPNH